MLEALANAFRVPDLRKKILFTLGSSRCTASVRTSPCRASRRAMIDVTQRPQTAQRPHSAC